MTARALAVLCTLLVASCSGKKGGGDADTDPEQDVADGETDAADEPDAEPPVFDPIVPVAGTISNSTMPCEGSYTLPAEFEGDEGLGHHGWTLDDLRFSMAWSVASFFESEWISGTGTSPSLRTHPWLVPEAGYCYVREVEMGVAEATEDRPTVSALVTGISPFTHPASPYGSLWKDVYDHGGYDLDVENVLARAIRGLIETPNELPGAPTVDPWSEELQEQIAAAVADYPPEMSRAVARLVLSVGEAYALKQEALADVDESTMARIHQQFLDDYYATLDTATASPLGGTVLADIISSGTWFHMDRMNAAAVAVAGAADLVREALEDVTPFDSPGLDVLTPHGRILVRTDAGDTTYTDADLADAAVVIDLGGNDSYGGRYASTHRFWMSASVLVDAAGDDLYTPETADIEAPGTTKWEAFANEQGFTQGCGLMGVGVLVDDGGTDTYTATLYAQGSGVFGVGVLYDEEGSDSYRLGANGQGMGFFGVGLAVDVRGDDRYGLYTTGQGAGKPFGHGALIDAGGTDTYICYYKDLEPWLPAPGYSNYFSLGSTWPYSDTAGNPHYMSNCQGIGWGYRHEWVTPERVWRGGFGALVDLGDGNDEHYADCMSMGQGFVYGFGFLYDDGGDDVYRTFWWGPAAAAHMGVGLLADEGGNDDYHVAHASGGFGYDCSVGWHIDSSGNDTYGGQFHYGKAYTYGLTFMLNVGGDDVYNDGSVLSDPPFGIVQAGYAGVNLLGLFMDLGGGADTYNSAYAGVGNDAAWYLDPIGTSADPAFHKGVGIDK